MSCCCFFLFENRSRGTLVAGTCLQRVRTTCTFTTVLQRFVLRGHFVPFGPFGKMCNVFYKVLPLAGKEIARNPHGLHLAAPRGLSWPLLAPRGYPWRRMAPHGLSWVCSARRVIKRRSFFILKKNYTQFLDRPSHEAVTRNNNKKTRARMTLIQIKIISEALNNNFCYFERIVFHVYVYLFINL